MCRDPAGRAGLSQRGSNSEIRASERERGSELQMALGGGGRKTLRGGKANERKRMK